VVRDYQKFEKHCIKLSGNGIYCYKCQEGIFRPPKEYVQNDCHCQIQLSV